MKSFIVIVVIIMLGYFAFEAFENSQIMNTETTHEQELRDEGLGDFDSDTPVSYREALTKTNSEGASIFEKIGTQITLWRIQVNTFINEKI